MTDFLPTNYELPVSEGGYMKLQQGENLFRVLSSPIIGWETWQDKKPFRFRMDNKPEQPLEKDGKIKHFWSMVVWNYGNNAVEILHLTQATILKSIIDLVNDKDWGKPFEYDIKIKRDGEGLDTEYTISPKPKTELNDDQKKAQAEIDINLEALFDNKNPFEKSSNKTVTEIGDEIKLENVDF